MAVKLDMPRMGVAVEDGSGAPLLLSVIALSVSVVAAAFTGWGAITAHLARTRSRPAQWTISQDVGRWLLHNVGGSLASAVTVRIGRLVHRERGGPAAHETSFPIGSIAPGGKAGLSWGGDGTMPSPSLRYRPRAAGSEVWNAVASDDDAPGARYLVDATAEVVWRDERGRQRRAVVKLR